MLSKYFKLALRSLFKNKFQTLILVGGLAAGMTACLLLLQYVAYELSFDNFHSKRPQIYRVVNERFQSGKVIQKGTITYPTIGAAMQRDFPEIVNHTRLMPSGEMFYKHGEKTARQDATLWVDEHFLEMFDFKILAKESGVLLGQVNEIALTRTVADVYFPWAKGDYGAVLGKEMFINNESDPYKITAVLEDVPANSLLQFNVLGSYATVIKNNGKDADESWVWSDFWHFVELAPGTDVAALEAKFPAFSERHFQGEKVSGNGEVFTLQAMKDAHLFSQGLEYEIGVTANGRAVWSLLIVALFILVIAWINYLNLSSVRAMERAKEVGIRKVVGANRKQLIGQFMTEALLVNLIALALSLFAVQTIKPWFSNNFDLKPTALTLLHPDNPLLFVAFAGLMALGILASGAYPAWLMSASPIAGILKGIFRKNTGGKTLRQGLVVFQFMASTVLILCAWMASRQIRFMSSQDLGVQLDRILRVDPPELTEFDSTYIGKAEAFKNTLKAHANIQAVCTSNRTPGDMMGRVFRMQKKGTEAPEERFTCNFIMADKDYAEAYKLQPLAGRFFREGDHNPDFAKLENIVLTESAVEMLSYASNEAALNQKVNFWNRTWTIVGVMPDFHQKSLHNAIEPILFVPSYSNGNEVSVRLSGENLDATIGFIGETFRQFFPGNIFEYSFVDENFQRLYEADARFGRILGFFTLMALLIACLGLFGLASYTTVLRTKEIGIRKVLGASVAGITGLLAKDFLKLVVIAILIASPVAYFFMQKWLSDFAYRIAIEWWMFARAGALAIVIAFLTVGGQAVRAALANPVKSLRSE